MSSSTRSSDAAEAVSVRDKVDALIKAGREGNLELFLRSAEQLRNEKEGLSEIIGAVKHANGCGALHISARDGFTWICKYLLEELHLSVDPKDDDGETPLIHAARMGHLDTAKYLLEHGADPAAASNQLGTTALHHAAGTGCVELINLLLSKGLPVDTPSDAGSPLIWAAGSDRPGAVKALLDHGANPNAKTDNNVTALLSAVTAGSLHCVELLVKRGADVNVNAGGATPLHIAEDNGNEKMINCLLEAGANPNARDDVLAENKKVALEAKSRGEYAFKNKDYLMAVDAYTQAIDLVPNNTTFFSNRSLCWIRLGQSEKALVDAKACREVRPVWSKACYREGAALCLLQRYDEAATAFYEGMKLDPKNKELVDVFREAVEAGRKFQEKK